MALTPVSRRRDNRTTVSDDPTQDQAPLGNMQEPLGSMDRPISRTSDNNDVNISSSGTGRTTGNLGTTPDRARGFGATFAIIAAVLVAAFLIALYLGNNRTNTASAPGTTQAPVAETSPGTSNDTTGSTTPTQPQQTAPAAGGSGNATGTGNGTGTGAGSNSGTGTTP